MEPLRRHLSYSNVMSTVAVFALAGGGAFAIGAIPDKSGKITACFVKKGQNAGDVRLLVKGTKCRRGEKKVAWNQKGVAGTPGTPGATGLQGQAGPQGEPGPPGAPNPNADLLDSLDSTAFLRSDAAAGGDLTGAFPAPQVADNAIGGVEGRVDLHDEIVDGGIDGDDIAEDSISSFHISEFGLDADTVDSMGTEARVIQVAPSGSASSLFSPNLPLTLSCDAGGLASMTLTNAMGGPMVSYFDNGASDPTFSSIPGFGAHAITAAGVSASDLIVWHAALPTSDPLQMVTYLIGVDESGSDCDFYVRALWQA